MRALTTAPILFQCLYYNGDGVLLNVVCLFVCVCLCISLPFFSIAAQAYLVKYC